MLLDTAARYRFKRQKQVLKYIGTDGNWEQFEKESEPGIVWAEVQTNEVDGLLERLN